MNLASFFNKKSGRIFLDYASTTPVSPETKRAMEPFLSTQFYNPGALYKEGVEVKKVLENARAKMALLLNVGASEIVFTGSGTESCNMAIRGVYDAARAFGILNPHIITSAFEHSAVLEVCRDIEKAGGEVTYIQPDEKGIIHAEKIIGALKENTVLVSVMYVNNEIGTIQPVRDIAQGIKKWREEKKSVYPYIHTDASQAFNHLSIHVDVLGVDLLTLDASKVYGPKGVGILMVKRKTRIKPIIFGGGQEGGLRSGTENIAGIVGATEAFSQAQKMREIETKRVSELSKYFLEKIKKEIPQAELNGHDEKRLSNIINICIRGLDSEFAVLKLDNFGIACAHVSSCKSADGNASYVVEALGKPECARSSLRFSFGRFTTKRDLDHALDALKKIT